MGPTPRLQIRKLHFQVITTLEMEFWEAHLDIEKGLPSCTDSDI